MRLRYFRQALVAVVVFLCSLTLFAQAPSDSVMTVTGRVFNEQNDPLPYVNISLRGTTLGTVSNQDGYFSLKIPKTDGNIIISVSYVGYYSTSASIKASLAHDMKFTLNPYPNLLNASAITLYDPEHIVRMALDKVRQNYPTFSIAQRGFYRETTQKGSRYISISEAVVDIVKSTYTRSSDLDRVKVLKGRRLVSQKSSDTLSVKLQGGPNLCLDRDVVKNQYDLFYKEDLTSYNYVFEESTTLDQRPLYVVHMTPRISNDDYPLYDALLYIDKESLAIVRVEFSVDMEDPDLVTQSILRKKPNGLRFTPQELSFTVSYREVDGLMILNYVRSDIRFRCDWRKRFFHSGYTIVSEMVATDVNASDVVPIPAREAFKDFDIFYDKVDDFSDPTFWGDYNIIEPTESLEHAVGRLKKRAK